MKPFGRKFSDLWLPREPVDVENVEWMKDEIEEAPSIMERETVEIPHAEPGAFQAVKSAILGHGEQTVLPDDCEFGDNDLCSVEA